MKIRINNTIIETSELWIDELIFVEDQDTEDETRSYFIGGKIPPASFKKINGEWIFKTHSENEPINITDTFK